MSHLKAHTIRATGQELGVGAVVANKVDPMACINDVGYHSWGVQIHHGKVTMQLYPETAAALPQLLRVVAAEVGVNEAVSFEHTSNKSFIVWATFTAAGAIDFAEVIEAAAK